ncbi:MAG TPA: phosphotransferase, partial [Puia sp.]|nr:phosphotransferase [Puia sp.]
TDPATGRSIVLQAINAAVFKQPDNILYNYALLFQYLSEKKTPVQIPAPVKTRSGNLGWRDEERHFWRATTFMEESYAPDTVNDPVSAKTVARCFASLTRSLDGLDPGRLRVIIPDFHNLTFRYAQLEASITAASMERLLKSTHVISELRERKYLLNFYESLAGHPDYPDRVMHHDCKISNILFHTGSGRPVCPVDLDTMMPGKFFSDLGDMIRSMAASVEENSQQWEDIDIRPDFYRAILEGYLEEMGGLFTKKEKTNIHYAGLLMIYMQALRFLADFLGNDVYYKTSYPEQNLHRALNQLLLLEKLEAFLSQAYSFDTTGAV